MSLFDRFDWLESVSRLAGDFHPRLQSVRSRILNDPYYRLQSMQDVRLAAQLGMTLDVNQASIDDWLRLPGISIHQARTLVALRQSGVAFHCLDDIAAALQQPVQRLRGLEPLLDFRYYDSEGVHGAPAIPVNTAPLDALMRVPAIDSALARAIVTHRQQSPYRDLVDLQRRLRLSSQLTAELLHYLRF